MKPNPDWVPEFEPDDVSRYVEEAIGEIDSETATQLGASITSIAAGAGPITATAIGIVSTTLAKDWVKRQGGNLNQELKGFIDQQENDEDKKRAWSIKIAKGVSFFLPNGDDLQEAAIKMGQGEPEELLKILNEYHENPEKEEEIDNIIKEVVTGKYFDKDNGTSELKAAFNAETLEEALAIFLDFSEIFLHKEMYDYLNKVDEIDSKSNAIANEIDDIRDDLSRNLRKYLEIEIQNEGIYRITPLYYRQKSVDPELCWQRPFNLAEIREGFAVERKMDTEAEKEQTLSSNIFEDLQQGQTKFIIGSPGSGKSTISKLVADKWYQNQIGPVLYRPSGGFFEKSASLRHRIEQLKDEGHVLVVVEDIARVQTKTIFEEIRTFSDDKDVSFLADSRKGEFKEIQREFLVDESHASKNVMTYIENGTEKVEVPGLSPKECKKIKEKYESVSGEEILMSGEELYEEVRSGDETIGEMILLTYHLNHGKKKGQSSLEKDVRAKVEQIENHNQTFTKSQWNGVSHDNNDLVSDLALLINLLNSSNIKVNEEILYNFSDETRKIEETLSSFKGWLVFESESGSNRIETPHEIWSEMYLQILAEEGGRLIPFRFAECLETILTITDSENSGKVREIFPNSEFFQRLEEMPYPKASFLTRVYVLGIQRPALEPLFDCLEPSLINLSEISPYIKSTVLMAKSDMFDSFGSIDEMGEILLKARRNLKDVDMEEKSKRGFILEVKILSKLSKVEVEKGNYREALNYLLDANELLDHFEDNMIESLILRKIGNIEQHIGADKYPLDYFVEAFELIEESNKKWEKLKTVSDILGVLLGECKQGGEYNDKLEEKIAEWGDKYKEIAEGVDEVHKFMVYYRDLAKIRAFNKEYQEARELLKKSLKTCIDKGDKKGEGRTRVLWANITHLEDIHEGAADAEIEKAIQHTEKAEEIFKEDGLFIGTMQSFHAKVYLLDDNGGDKELRQTCKDALEYIDEKASGNSEEHIHDFAYVFNQKLAKVEDRHIGVRETYKEGLANIINGNYELAEMQLKEAWELRKDHSKSCHQFGEANRAYIALLSVELMSETELDVKDRLQKAIIGRNRMSSPCLAIFDLLNSGSPNLQSLQSPMYEKDNSIKDRVSKYEVTEELERLEKKAFGTIADRIL